MVSENQLDYISTRLKVDKLPLTAVLMSRSLDISTSEASEAIQSFYELNKQNSSYEGLNIKYSVCGISKNERNDILVKIVDESKLKDVQDHLYLTVSKCQVYSIQLSDKLPFSNIAMVNDMIQKPYSKDNMIKWGVILTETDGVADNAINVEIKRENQQQQQQPIKRSKTEQPVSSKSASVLINKAQEEQGSRYVSRKASTLPPPVSKPKTEYVSRKRKSGVVADNHTSNEEEEDVDIQVTKRTKVLTEAERDALKKQEEKLKNLFDDDDFSDDDPIVSHNERKGGDDIGVDIGSDEQEEDGNVISEPSNVDKFFSKKEPEEEMDKPTEEVIEDLPEFETVTDADGFITTKRNVKHQPAKPKPKPKPLPSNVGSSQKSFEIDTKKKPAAKKQASLMNFFKKKN